MVHSALRAFDRLFIIVVRSFLCVPLTMIFPINYYLDLLKQEMNIM